MLGKAGAQKDPYFGMLTDEKYRSDKLAFFESGEIHVNHVLSVCGRHFSPAFTPKRTIDFGCGVDRLVIPLANISDEVIGLDISEGMLEEARKNCTERHTNNVKFLKSDNDLFVLDGEFDFVHSCVVLPHIPISRGNHIFMRLIEHLSSEGIRLSMSHMIRVVTKATLSFLK